MGRETTKPGTLYVVATPIGNLEDLTFRALRVLKDVDWIAAEDTRTSRKLLNTHGIRTPLVAYHEQGAKMKGGRIVRQLRNGKNVALVSEGGTPGISDPGYDLIQACLNEDIHVVPIPGPSAILAALSIGGLPTDRFVFEGFLPRRRPQRLRALKGLREEPRTLVIFESPRRLRAMLADMLEIFGDRKGVLTRELTKAFEEVRRGSLKELLEWSEKTEFRGEFTLLVAGHSGDVLPIERVRERVTLLKHKCGLADREVVRVLREETGLPGKVIYKEVLSERHHRH